MGIQDDIFKAIIKSKKTSTEIYEFCKIHNEYCSGNKNVTGKKILNLVGYKTDDKSFNYGDLFKEMMTLTMIKLPASDEITKIALSGGIPPAEELLALTPTLKKIMALKASNELRRYMLYNGIDLSLEKTEGFTISSFLNSVISTSTL
jgi:hypothetical protein